MNRTAAGSKQGKRRRCESKLCRAPISRPGSIASRCSRESTIRGRGRRRAISISDLVLLDLDPRIRPGMTAVARIATERIPNVVLIPSEAIFQRDGAPVVYELDGSEFQERRVQITKRGKEQAIVASGIEPGDRIATRRPSPEMIRRSE